MSETGSTVFNGALALSGDNVRIVTERSVTFGGTTTWTNTVNTGGSSTPAAAPR